MPLHDTLRDRSPLTVVVQNVGAALGHTPHAFPLWSVALYASWYPSLPRTEDRAPACCWQIGRFQGLVNDACPVTCVFCLCLLQRHKYPTWRCCESRSGEEPGRPFRSLRTLSAQPSLPTGDWRTQQQQHECCTPAQLDYTVPEWVCSTPSTLSGTPSTMSSVPLSS